MFRSESGHTFIELAVGLALFGLLVLIMMPSFQGYQANAQVRELGEQVVAQLRAAETEAAATDQTLQWGVCGDCATNYVRVNLPGGGTASFTNLSSGTTAAPLHVTWTCYRGPISPSGSMTVASPPCAAPPGATFELVCFDSNTPANPYGIQITVVIATGQIISTKVGRCQ
jgi:type II secretory pathway pseudopilin PulG